MRGRGHQFLQADGASVAAHGVVVELQFATDAPRQTAVSHQPLDRLITCDGAADQAARAAVPSSPEPSDRPTSSRTILMQAWWARTAAPTASNRFLVQVPAVGYVQLLRSPRP